MDTHRIDIFHIADNNGIIRIVTHNLIFDFLIAGNALFDQTLVYR